MKTSKINIFTISGSTRSSSSNLNLIKAIANLTTDRFSFTIFNGLTELPHFNPDIDLENPPQQVIDFRNQLAEADAVLICTPEYAIGVPGSLKNAIDWTVSSMSFSKKPVALITASLSGAIAHQSLLGTLLIIESKMTTDTQLLIPLIKSKVNDACEITDIMTLNEILKLSDSLEKIVNNDTDNFLTAPLLR